MKVYVRALGGNPVFLRPGTSDWKVLGETFHGRFHVPPKKLVGASARRILDLGANIGLTAAHFAVLYPEAHVVAVEMDAENAALARMNVSPWTGRCDVIESAVWTTDGTVRYVLDPGIEYGASIQPHGREVPSVSLNTLIRGGEPIDYLKIDIEGAEKEVLRQRTEWADSVRCINVETHGSDYGVRECTADLQALGFATSVMRNHFGAVLAWRP